MLIIRMLVTTQVKKIHLCSRLRRSHSEPFLHVRTKAEKPWTVSSSIFKILYLAYLSDVMAIVPRHSRCTIDILYRVGTGGPLRLDHQLITS